VNINNQVSWIWYPNPINLEIPCASPSEYKHESLHNANLLYSHPPQPEMSAIHQFIINQKARALSEGIKIVRDILKSNRFPDGFTTSQLFHVAVQQPPPPDFPAYHHTGLAPVVKPNKNKFVKVKPVMPWAPSHPEHPIRSIRSVYFSNCSMMSLTLVVLD